MDRNTLTAFFLIMVILIGFQYFNPAKPPEKPTSAATTDTTAQAVAAPTTAAALAATSTAPALLQSFHQDSIAKAAVAVLENDLLQLTFTNKGAQLESATLKNYKTAAKQPLQLIQAGSNDWHFEMFVNNNKFSSDDFLFTLHEKNDTALIYRLYADSISYIEQSYKLGKNKYIVQADTRLVGFNNRMSTGAPIQILWNQKLLKQERTLDDERSHTSAYYRDKEEEVEALSYTGNDLKENVGTVQWVAHKQRFFNQTLIDANPADALNFELKSLQVQTPAADAPDSLTVKSFATLLNVSYEATPNFTLPMQFYIGPNDYQTLRSKGIGLEHLVNLGWSIFGWVNRFLIIPVFNLFEKFFSNYGIIIFLLTLFIKIIIMPFTYRSYIAMAKMNVLRPELEAIKQKYPDDMQKQQQEQMKLYNSAGVNPLGGCLPQLFQLPILLAMYNFFPSSIQLRQESFLWVKDLSSYDAIINFPFKIPFLGDHLSLFTVLMALLTYFSMYQSMKDNVGQQAAQMKIMMYFMPIFLLFIFNSLPAALTYYYTLFNLLNMIQQWYLKKYVVKEDDLKKQLAENQKKPRQTSGFQKRLQDMMEQAQEQQKRQSNKK
ncbi:MAG: membrane protein insertase YidC [Sphingobacteriales bacterium]|nr:membrane protein insertase YidC [Sphingobacteriales bacterium]